MENFSERLENLRLVHKVSVESIANYLGVTVQSYKRYEKGERVPDLEGLVKLASFFNCSLDYLVGMKNQHSELARAEVVCYQDLVSKGLGSRFSHALLKEIIDKQSFDERIVFEEMPKVKFVKKESIKELLEKVIQEICDN